MTPLVDIVVGCMTVWGFEEFKLDAVRLGHMHDAEIDPVGPAYIRAHHTNISVILIDRRRRHDGIETHDFGIKLHRRIEIRDRQADV